MDEDYITDIDRWFLVGSDSPQELVYSIVQDPTVWKSSYYGRCKDEGEING
jgi:hypothetical protein